jgi:hypothetical protein
MKTIWRVVVGAILFGVPVWMLRHINPNSAAWKEQERQMAGLPKRDGAQAAEKVVKPEPEPRKIGYEISTGPQEGQWVSPNPQQALRAVYEPAKLLVRQSSGQQFELEIVTAGVFEGKAPLFEPVSNPVIIVENNQIRFGHRGFTSFYSNDERGLQQGVAIESAPLDIRQFDIRLHVKGLPVRLIGEDQIQFGGGPGQPSLTYASLKCSDAVGMPLAAELIVRGSFIVIRISGASNRYPITLAMTIARSEPLGLDPVQ